LSRKGRAGTARGLNKELKESKGGVVTEGERARKKERKIMLAIREGTTMRKRKGRRQFRY